MIFNVSPSTKVTRPMTTEPASSTPADTPRSKWLAALLYGFPMGVLFSVQSGNWILGMSGGLLAGVIFGVLMARFAKGQAKRFVIDRPDFAGEDVTHEGLANHFKGAEGVGGYLWLTTGRLVFRSHKLNIQNHEWAALLSDIVKVEATKTLGMIPNGLQITLTSGETHKFVVNQNLVWQEAIRAALVSSHT
jgi:hypothetical protein